MENNMCRDMICMSEESELGMEIGIIALALHAILNVLQPSTQGILSNLFPMTLSGMIMYDQSHRTFLPTGQCILT